VLVVKLKLTDTCGAVELFSDVGARATSEASDASPFALSKNTMMGRSGPRWFGGGAGASIVQLSTDRDS